jgi:tetratricopeptide (TPR) repeat protein
MRTKTIIQRLSVLCAGSMLLACADLFEAGAPPAGASAADDAYAQGRNQYLARRYEDAMASYRKALQADPRHVNARNGLATLYAERRDFGRAIEIWQGLTDKAGIAAGPDMAFLFNNLGYAYYLKGDYDKALVALEKACLLDPLNQRAWQHLGEALQKVGQDERAAQMLRQAEALRNHDLRADYATTGGERVPAVDAAVKAPARPDGDFAAVELSRAADGTLVLRRGPDPLPPAAAQRAAQPAPVPLPSQAPAAPELVLLEIRNGNGVNGMAKALSQRMGDPRLKVVRLSNDKGFRVQQTRVEYQGAFRAAAERLAGRIEGAKVVEVNDCKPSDMRLVIGRDLARGKFVLRPLAPKDAPDDARKAAPTLAAADPGKSG